MAFEDYEKNVYESLGLTSPPTAEEKLKEELEKLFVKRQGLVLQKERIEKDGSLEARQAAIEEAEDKAFSDDVAVGTALRKASEKVAEKKKQLEEECRREAYRDDTKADDNFKNAVSSVEAARKEKDKRHAVWVDIINYQNTKKRLKHVQKMRHKYPLLDSLQEKLIAAEKAFKEADEKLNSNNAFEPIGKIDETNEAAYAEWKERFDYKQDEDLLLPAEFTNSKLLDMAWSDYDEALSNLSRHCESFCSENDNVENLLNLIAAIDSAENAYGKAVENSENSYESVNVFKRDLQKKKDKESALRTKYGDIILDTIEIEGEILEKTLYKTPYSKDSKKLDDLFPAVGKQIKENNSYEVKKRMEKRDKFMKCLAKGLELNTGEE